MKALRSVSRRTRFEIFKRDGFRCLYCGATPVAKPLHVDHVVPLAEGGSNSPANLVTACGDCNRGKAAVPLRQKHLAPKVLTLADKDHAQQILEYLAIQRQVEAARHSVATAFFERWEKTVGGLSQEMASRFSGLVRQWPIEKLFEAMDITGDRLGSVGEEYRYLTALHQQRYFYGILRRWREEGSAGAKNP